MFNKTIMTAGTLILSMMVLIAATQIDTEKVKDQERNDNTLSGIVVDADSEEGVPNATVYLKKANGEEGMQADRTQQQQQQHQDRATEHDQDELDSTTTDQNGEFEFDMDQIRMQGAQTGVQSQQPGVQAQQQGAENEAFVLVVEAEGYETEEKEINLSDYLDRDQERGAMDRDQDRDRDYDSDQDMDRDRDDDKDKDKDKLKIELTRSN
ncbi:hypothetical protein BH23BAC3_BH23BAC3_17400 [soil metagenome]